jgi:hypothetical protein
MVIQEVGASECPLTASTRTRIQGQPSGRDWALQPSYWQLILRPALEPQRAVFPPVCPPSLRPLAARALPAHSRPRSLPSATLNPDGKHPFRLLAPLPRSRTSPSCCPGCEPGKYSPEGSHPLAEVSGTMSVPHPHHPSPFSEVWSLFSRLRGHNLPRALK